MQLTNEQARWYDLARRFAQEEVKPRVDEMERAAQFPLQFMKRMGELGILGIPFPKEYGGQGGDTFSLILCVKEITKVWASLGLSMGAHMLGSNPIFFSGTEAQKKRYLTPLAKGEVLGSFGLTEPSSGSDAGSTQTVAVRSNGSFIINGKKTFTTSASYATYYIVSAVTDKAKGKKGVSAFIVERNYPGLLVGKKEEKIGLLASDTSGLILDGCKVPAENLLGEEGHGFSVFLKTLDTGRLGIAGWCLGLAEAAYEEALKWAQKRNITENMMEAHEFEAGALADMATKIEAAALLAREACRLKDEGKSYTKLASMAKYFASAIAVENCDAAIKMVGYEALTQDLPIERFFRDAKLGEIGEGTSEIQRLVIAREVLREAETLVPA